MAKVKQEKFYFGIRQDKDVFHVGYVTPEEWQEDSRIYFPPVKEVDWTRLLKQRVVEGLKEGQLYRFSSVVSEPGLQALEEEMTKLPWADVLYIEA